MDKTENLIFGFVMVRANRLRRGGREKRRREGERRKKKEEEEEKESQGMETICVWNFVRKSCMELLFRTLVLDCFEILV